MGSASAGQGKLWGGRFSSEPSEEMDRLNKSLPVDHRLWVHDIAGSRAWAAALGRAGVISAADADRLLEGLQRVEDRLGGWTEREWENATDEDIHSLVERLLRVEVGAVAGKLHTGRSRNDQVGTDTRLWSLAAIDGLLELVADVQTALVEMAEKHSDVVMPSYTHLQRAQPISAAHWLLSHAWALSRDGDRLREARRRTAILPLGSGAIAGCPFPVDREFLKDQLGFDEVSPNSIDAVGDRDWIAEILFTCAMLGVHLSRVGEDLILFTSAEFGFVMLSDQYSTGSSLMPQKRNPDAMELARGKAGRLIGAVVSSLALLKGLPTGYNKDLQEDKETLFETFDTLRALLPAVAGTLRTMQFNRGRCLSAVDPSMLATDLADYLVRSGVPFREAHEMVGKLVRIAEETGVPLSDLPPETFVEVSETFRTADLGALFDPVRSLEARSVPGGTATSSVKGQIEKLRNKILIERG